MLSLIQDVTNKSHVPLETDLPRNIQLELELLKSKLENLIIVGSLTDERKP